MFWMMMKMENFPRFTYTYLIAVISGRSGWEKFAYCEILESLLCIISISLDCVKELDLRIIRLSGLLDLFGSQ